MPFLGAMHRAEADLAGISPIVSAAAVKTMRTATSTIAQPAKQEVQDAVEAPLTTSSAHRP